MSGLILWPFPILLLVLFAIGIVVIGFAFLPLFRPLIFGFLIRLGTISPRTPWGFILI